MTKIVHLVHEEKCIPSFIHFVQKECNINDHLFVFVGKIRDPKLQSNSGVIQLNSLKNIYIASKQVRLAQKICIHGLFRPQKLCFILLHIHYCKKMYWILWGGDLYAYQNRHRSIAQRLYEYIRSFIIRRVGYIVNSMEQEFLLAQQWYGVSATHIPYYVYPNLVYRETAPPLKQDTITRVIVGNSATPTNRHSYVFQRIHPIISAHQEVLLYCPLSYGDREYAAEITRMGTEMFGSTFVPMRSFMPFHAYIAFLQTIDIAIFYHDRQQAMANIITLLGMGKKVYMPDNISSTKHLRSLGITVYSLENFSLDTDFQEASKNTALIKTYYSEAQLRHNLQQLFAS